MKQAKSSTRILYPSDEDFHVVCRINSEGKTNTLVIIRSLTELEVAALTQGCELKFNHNDIIYSISSDQCYAFGSIDLENQDDIDLINSFKWTTTNKTGSFIPGNYDYETNTGGCEERLNRITKSVDKIPAIVETFDNVKLFKYAYACIGKPENIVIYGIKVTNRYSKQVTSGL